MQGLDGWIGVHQAVQAEAGTLTTRCTAGRKPADAMLGEQAHLPPSSRLPKTRQRLPLSSQVPCSLLTPGRVVL